MRRILVEQARHKKTEMAGGHLQRLNLSAVDLQIDGPELDLIALDEALEKLALKDPRKAELVKLRFFIGLTNQQAADLLGVATSTCELDWSYAKCWLRVEMAGEAPKR